MLTDTIRGALAAVGREVIDADVAATPTAGVLVREHAAAGGIQISASHNPAPYNGIKLFGRDGRVIPAATGEQVLARYLAGGLAWVDYEQVAPVRVAPDVIGAHCERVLATVDVRRIRRQRFTVLLDANHGAGSGLGMRLLDDLGCRVTLLGGVPDGRFDHPPEPTTENLAGVAQRIRPAEAAVGFCQDPDADRLALIDQRGRCLGEEYTLALCVAHVLSWRRGPIVTNCSTSRMSEDLARAHGVPFFRSRVGEAHVADMMIEHQAVFGGEGNGGPIDPRVGYVRDSFVGIALVLDALAASGKSLNELAASLPQYAIHKTTATLPLDRVGRALEALQDHFPDAVADRLDGLRLDWPNRWLLVRGSNTEPMVRIVAEAGTAAEAKQLCDQAVAVIEALGGPPSEDRA
jgi:phosphomannomutase